MKNVTKIQNRTTGKGKAIILLKVEKIKLSKSSISVEKKKCIGLYDRKYTVLFKKVKLRPVEVFRNKRHIVM